MATGGFKSNSATDFLEEWKAKREKMRAKMLGDIAAATGRTTELNNNGSSVNCVSSSSSYPVTRSSSSTALKDEPKKPEPPGENLKKTPEKVSGVPQAESSSPAGVEDSDKESPTHGKSKENKSSGPSARKGKGQIEKRKLREKRRSTGVVSIPSNESLDELDDDDGEEKERKMEESLTQHNTVQNEAMTPDPGAAYSIQDTPRSRSHKSDEEGNRHRHRHGREGSGAALTSQERRIEELERELAAERQENSHLLKAHQDKDELIVKLKEEIDLLNRDLDDIEDENEQLKQENKTLLKVVGQLTR
ncbi:PRKC apoptosis WT1 regulator protein-like [Sinocyclocheilus anshuiensis]|uniref:PRKC apoptosis WT1 regulator protein-like n=1 Tax=Sinocyclocheilus anshuiensis TaxID=1608454 RepID=A0A671L682_9TELE|nr:PREDICTED: PRKC apoptosis WT1 regulator protein-like [Sinocyclocheilus anshuiensis]XP_016349294.1 PREDICTED: PRKC apoptosis WT1 regulator protein-like [Sinocyclocheilus anshuiensis]